MKKDGDALNATKAAVDEGIVAGGGTALLAATKKLDALENGMANFDQKVGVQIIRAALKVPVRTIAGNAGVEGSVVVEKVLASNEQNWGYDAATGEYGCMIKAGVIDPLKVVRTALVDGVRVQPHDDERCMITEGPPDPAGRRRQHGRQHGGMGGMGGMGF